MPETAQDVLFRPVTELAAQVRSGELSSRELVQTSLDRIEALNPQLNAFVDVYDDALEEADGIAPGDPRPFAGVPIAIKNNRSIAGRRLTFAAELMGDFVAPTDHNTVRRLKDAGFVIVGSTTLPEYGILPVTETRRFGATRNPWDTGRTPGGSSGGSAAAVASGMVPIAHANDGGGSTRIPAACCGLVGLKPQRGRISLAPELGYQLLVQDGVLTRTVQETAELLDVLAGPELGDIAWAPAPEAPFAELARRDPGRLRIALVTRSPLEDATLDPVHAQALRDAAELLSGLGHEVVEVEDVPWTVPGVLQLFSASFGPALTMQMAFAGMVNGTEPSAQNMEPLSWAIWELCQGISATQAALADAQLQGFARAIVTFTAGYDLLLMPSLAEAPVPLGTIDACSATPMEDFARSGLFTPYTAISNLTGSPAISLPLYERPAGDPDAGLPVGVQLVGQPAGEGTLLAVGAQLEAAAPWAARRAPVS
ncbi:amidase [Conexibacter sp. W3-3-2]|uniref:amidase n=1 Tax=Conexibacter sp. W3-3-2 TaxID=2675227 RepID=UPI0012B8E3AB|nr:amidase [Conexibacter sp. W3-3-2]MTD45732.1 amidase [Conexibacter sp. W3-3-2]